MNLLWRFIKKFFCNKNYSPQNENILFVGGNVSLPKGELRKRSREEWVESVFFDFSKEELSRTDKNYLGLGVGEGRLLVFFAALIMGLSLLFFRSVHLQIVNGDNFLQAAERNRLRILNLPSARGIIYDVNAVALVKNVPDFSIYLTPFDLFGDEEKWSKTRDWLIKSFPEKEASENLQKILAIRQTQKEFFEPIFFVGELNYETAILMRVESASHPGVSVEVGARREYFGECPQADCRSLSHVLGYVGLINPDEYKDLYEQGYLFNDKIGRTGVEQNFEKLLRGVYGKEQIEVDSLGKATKIVATDEMTKGDNIYLSVELEAQKKLEQIVRNYLTVKNKKRAVAIALDPQTGEIKALVNWPSYDNNLFASGIKQDEFSALINNPDLPLFNRAISGEYPSGSTIKPIIAAAALQENVINESKSFLSVGGVRIGEWFFPDWKLSGHGITDVRKALADSVNTFFYFIGGGYGDFKGLGVSKIKEYAEKFGLNKKTGIDLPNERSGFLPTPEWKKETKNEPWYIGDTYHLAIGQGDLLVTPLQVANYTAAFANGGKILKPQIVDRYYDQKTKRFMTVEPKIINQNFISEKNLNIVRQGMRQSVTSGSSKILNSLPVKAAAKTGTAQWGRGKNPHAWFTAFAPYDNASLVLTVLVEEGEEGSAISAQIAHDFMQWYFK